MALDFYDQGLEGIFDGTIDLLGADLKLALVDTSYTRDLAADKFMSAISSGDIIVRSANLGGKTQSGRVFDASDTTFTAAPAGTGTQVVLYQDTGGSDATRRLIANWDSGSGLPIVTNGADVNVAFSNGANKVLAVARA